MKRWFNIKQKGEKIALIEFSLINSLIKGKRGSLEINLFVTLA